MTGTGEDASRLAVALEVGADHAIHVTADDPVEAVMDLTGGFGASLAVDLASAPITPGLCFDLVHQRGTVVWAGLKDRQAVPVVSDKVVMKGLTVLGGAGGDVASVDEAARILESHDPRGRRVLSVLRVTAGLSPIPILSCRPTYAVTPADTHDH